MKSVNETMLREFELAVMKWSKKYGWKVSRVHEGYGLRTPSVCIEGLLPGMDDNFTNYHKVEYDSKVIGEDIDLVMEGFVAKLREEKKKRTRVDDD